MNWISAAAHAVPCLASVHKSRHDAEGVDDIDVEASTSPQFMSWEAALSFEDRGRLGIYRFGATQTRTRTNQRHQGTR